jgi:hypothetical protein
MIFQDKQQSIAYRSEKSDVKESVKMNRFLMLPVLLGCLRFTCLGEDTVERAGKINEFRPQFEKKSTLYVWLDNFRIREEPDLSSEVIDLLQFADEVQYVGKMSKLNSRVTIRGQAYDAPWVKVRTKSGVVGWAYSVGFKNEFIEIYTQSGYPEEQTSFAHLYVNLSPFIRDEEGNRLVATEEIDDPDTLTRAVFSKYYPEKVADVRRIGTKAGTGGDFFSYERAAGPLYEVTGSQKAEGNGLVVDNRFFNDRALVPISSTWGDFPGDSEQFKELKERIEESRKWPVEDMWIKYEDEQSNLLAIVLHKVYRGHVMLSIVFVTPDQVISHDHIREYTEGDDLFRVDDMGEFDSYNVSFDFLFKSRGAYEMVYHWDGAEGRNIYIVRQHGDRFFLGRRIYQPVSY